MNLTPLYILCQSTRKPKDINKNWFQLGNEAFSLKKYEKAKEYYEVGIQQEPNNVTLWGNLSATKCKLNDFHGAIKDADTAISIKPTWAKGRFRKALALHGIQRDKEAFKLMIQACVLDKANEKSFEAFRAALLELIPPPEQETLIQQAYEEISLFLDGNDKKNKENLKTQVPVTVLSGFLGSGKTTLLSRILSNSKGYRVAVLVNDMADINIDAQLISNSHIFNAEKPSLIELTNGCICCTLRDDLLREVTKLATASPPFDYIVIESTGISEPLPVAMTFSMDDVPSGISLPSVARLDCMVTVVDCTQFISTVSSNQRLKDKGWETTLTDQRTLADLLIDQIEFANIILLNKCDLLTKITEIDDIEKVVTKLNPTAKVIRTTRCEEVPIEFVLNSHLFNMDEASKSAGWKKELLFPHQPETLEYGISSFTFREFELGFDSKKVTYLLLNRSLLDNFGVIRAKGYLWITQEDRIVLEFASAGPNVNCKTAGFWNCAVDNDDGKKKNDRKIELVFIGINIKANQLKEELKSCLSKEKKRDPTCDGIGKELFEMCFEGIYQLIGDERRFSENTMKMETSRFQQIRSRLEYFSELKRDLTKEEIEEATILKEEFMKIKQQRQVS